MAQTIDGPLWDEWAMAYPLPPVVDTYERDGFQFVLRDGMVEIPQLSSNMTCGPTMWTRRFDQWSLEPSPWWKPWTTTLDDTLLYAAQRVSEELDRRATIASFCPVEPDAES